MSELTDGFKCLISGTVPDTSLLVPLLRWVSGSYGNIETCQKINKQFYHGNHKLYILELTLNSNIKHFIKYPKGVNDDKKIVFFYNDLAKYFGWTRKELQKNLTVIDIDKMKPVIAKVFGYNNKERKLIGLKKITGLKNCF